MGVRLKLWSSFRAGASKPRASTTVSVGEILTDPEGGSIQLPILPPSGIGASGIEYAAASVLERAVLGMLGAQRIGVSHLRNWYIPGVTALTMALNAPNDAIVWTLELPEQLSPEQVAAQFYRGTKRTGFHQMASEGADRLIGAAFRSYSGS